ncbi:hypothetical protein ACFXPN_45850 [Streptomyces griseorubiginosus]|uniref:hypothetical protein n=1 Tax=Streptomyces griseorubiginosus TaxID=67304 RepID=UPI0036C5AABF
MSQLQQIEDIAYSENWPLSYVLARHIFDHHLHGRVFIVTDKPSAMISSVRKGWRRIRRNQEKEYARTLDKEKRASLHRKIAIMDSLTFSMSRHLADSPDVLFFVTSEELAKRPRQCLVLYLTHEVDDTTLERLTCTMPVGGYVVRCSMAKD